MVNFRNHGQTKKVTLKDSSDVEQEYEFIALGAKYLPKVFKVVSKFSTISEDTSSNELLDKLDEDTVEVLTELVTAMVKKSYSTIPDEDIDGFVGTHFIELFPLVFELNMPSK